MIKLDKIDREEALRYLAFSGKAADEFTEKLLNEAEAEILKILRPRYTYRILPIEASGGAIRLSGVRLTLTGNDILSHLSGCHLAVLLCATLSIDADAYIRQQQTLNMAKALVADALENAAIEQVCDLAEEEIKSAHGLKNCTSRYSPGYGDLPLDIQGDFLAAVDAGRRLGVYINESNLLTPLKTVTAIIGISDGELPDRNNENRCDRCSKRDTCSFRKAGKSCEI